MVVIRPDASCTPVTASRSPNIAIMTTQTIRPDAIRIQLRPDPPPDADRSPAHPLGLDEDRAPPHGDRAVARLVAGTAVTPSIAGVLVTGGATLAYALLTFGTEHPRLTGTVRFPGAPNTGARRGPRAMRPTVIMVMGVSGSGKSTVGERARRRAGRGVPGRRRLPLAGERRAHARRDPARRRRPAAVAPARPRGGPRSREAGPPARVRVLGAQGHLSPHAPRRRRHVGRGLPLGRPRNPRGATPDSPRPLHAGIAPRQPAGRPRAAGGRDRRGRRQAPAGR